MWKALRGLGVPAPVVGAARGLVEAVAFAAGGAVIIWVAGLDLPDEWKVIIPVVTLAWRQGEGILDGIDPEKRRRPQ